MNSEKKYRIQNIVFPTESKHMMCKELFYHGENGYLDRENQTITLGTGQAIDFISYINSCSWAKWKKYTNAQNVSLNLDIEGSFELRYVGYTMEYRELVRKEFGVIKKEGAGREIVSFDYEDNDETIIGVEITAIDRCSVYGGFYEVEYEGDLNEIELSLATTTCRKEDFIRKNIQLIKDSILNGDDDIKDHLTVHVVDNGRTLKDEEIVGEHVLLHPNPNTGGSGGFARGMMESIHQEKQATHVLLMDDDVLVLPESMKRLYHLLRLRKDEYKSRFISGAMLRYEKPMMQHEDIGTLSQELLFRPLKPALDNSEIESLVKNEDAYYSSHNKFSAWWYCCIPMDTIKKNGLPMPFFVRGDDSEYSLRCKAQFISMNGIFVWHMGFALKFNAAMDVYQQFRNLLIASDTNETFGQINIYSTFTAFFYKELMKFNYSAVELQLRAFEDYLKGPDFLLKSDGEAIIKANAKLNEKYEPLSQHPDINIYMIEDCYEDAPGKIRDKVLFRLTHNGQRMCPEFLYHKTATLPVAAFDFSIQHQKISMVKQYAAVNPFEEKVAIRTLDKARYHKLMKRYKKLDGFYKKNHSKLAAEYRNAKEYMTSEEFWRKYLGMEAK